MYISASFPGMFSYSEWKEMTFEQYEEIQATAAEIVEKMKNAK